MNTRFLTFLLAVTLAQPALATQVKEVVSPGGIKAWLVEEHSLPLIAVRIAFKDSGYAYDPKGEEGRANMTAALLTEGAGDLSSREFNEALENHALRFGTGVSEDLMYVSMEGLSEHKEKLFSYLGMAMADPRFDSDAVERTRRQTLSLIKHNEQEPGYMLSLGWQYMAYGNHPYAKPQLGLTEDVEDLSASDFRDYTKRYLTRENMLVSVVGDITPEDLGRLLDEHLKALPEKYNPDSKVEDTHLKADRDPVVIDFNIPQSIVIFGADGLKRSDPDYFAAYVMNQVLGGQGALTARLGQEIREKRGLAYSVSSFLDPMLHAGAWRGSFATRNEEVRNALEVLIDTLAEFSETGPTEKEMTDAKRYLTGSFTLELDSNESIAAFLISMQLHNLGIDYLDKRNAMVEAVTRDKVKEMAAKLANPEKLLIIMVGKPNLKKTTEAQPQQ